MGSSMMMIGLPAAIVGLVVLQASPVPPAEDAAAEAGRARVAAWLAQIPGVRGGAIKGVTDPAVERVFPGDRFYSVYFTAGPRAPYVPRPLHAYNLVRVAPNGQVGRVVPTAEADALTLASVFRERLSGPLSESLLRDAAGAALRLGEELYQDGHFAFKVEAGEVISREADHLVARGRASVSGGGQGEVTVTLTTDAAGRLAEVASTGRVRADSRPR
jgi:hypothetical protein